MSKKIDRSKLVFTENQKKNIDVCNFVIEQIEKDPKISNTTLVRMWENKKIKKEGLNPTSFITTFRRNNSVILEEFSGFDRQSRPPSFRKY